MARVWMSLVLAVAACATEEPPPSGPDGGSPLHPQPDAGTPDAQVPDATALPDLPRRECDGTDLRLGTGPREYSRTLDADTVHLYRGPQGGYMVYLAVQAFGFDPQDVWFCYDERFALSGQSFGRGCWHVTLRKDLGDGWWERAGIWAQVDPAYWDRPDDIRGEAVHIEGTLVDPATGCAETRTLRVRISERPGT